MSELSAGDTIEAVVSGFSHEEGFSGMLAIAQYEKGILKNVVFICFVLSLLILNERS